MPEGGTRHDREAEKLTRHTGVQIIVRTWKQEQKTH